MSTIKNINQQFELYDSAFKAVYSSAYRIVEDAHLAEEIAQDAFVKYFTLPPIKANKIDNTKGFLCKLAINAAIDYIRKRKIETTPLSTIEYSITNQNEELMESELTIEAVQHAMQELPTGYKIVLNLKIFEGLDFDEIASFLNIAPSTARTQYSRGKALLAQKIKKL